MCIWIHPHSWIDQIAICLDVCTPGFLCGLIITWYTKMQIDAGDRKSSCSHAPQSDFRSDKLNYCVSIRVAETTGGLSFSWRLHCRTLHRQKLLYHNSSSGHPGRLRWSSHTGRRFCPQTQGWVWYKRSRCVPPRPVWSRAAASPERTVRCAPAAGHGCDEAAAN